MTAEKSPQAARLDGGWLSRIRSMEFTVLVRVDASGSRPILVRVGEELLAVPGVRWSLYGQTDDYAEAMRLMESARRVRLQLDC